MPISIDYETRPETYLQARVVTEMYKTTLILKPDNFRCPSHCLICKAFIRNPSGSSSAFVCSFSSANLNTGLRVQSIQSLGADLTKIWERPSARNFLLDFRENLSPRAAVSKFVLVFGEFTSQPEIESAITLLLCAAEEKSFFLR
jgi:hypothetical protein